MFLQKNNIVERVKQNVKEYKYITEGMNSLLFPETSRSENTRFSLEQNLRRMNSDIDNRKLRKYSRYTKEKSYSNYTYPFACSGSSHQFDQ